MPIPRVNPRTKLHTCGGINDKAGKNDDTVPMSIHKCRKRIFDALRTMAPIMLDTMTEP
jgi:hypothetical protein